MSSNGAPTENISWYVEHFLQPLVTEVSSYIPDTTDILNKLQRLPPLPMGSLLVTLDISSLYTNTPHDEGITACDTRDNKEESPAGVPIQPAYLNNAVTRHHQIHRHLVSQRSHVLGRKNLPHQQQRDPHRLACQTLHQYLHTNSCYPEHFKTATPCSETL